MKMLEDVRCEDVSRCFEDDRRLPLATRVKALARWPEQGARPRLSRAPSPEAETPPQMQKHECFDAVATELPG